MRDSGVDSGRDRRRRPEGRKRLAYAVLIAVTVGLLLAWGNPADRVKADLRADTKGFAISLEYTANLLRVRK